MCGLLILIKEYVRLQENAFWVWNISLHGYKVPVLCILLYLVIPPLFCIWCVLLGSASSQWRRNGPFAWAGLHANHLSHQQLCQDVLLAMGDQRLLLKLILLRLLSLWVKPYSIWSLCQLCRTWPLWCLQTMQHIDNLGLWPLGAVTVMLFATLQTIRLLPWSL